MKEITKWIRLAILAFIPLAGVIAVNLIGDTANLFHSGVSNDIALSILAGNATYGVGALDERGVKRALIENLPDEVDTLAFGPSLVMCVNKDLAGTDSFYNLGESGADYYDILAQFGLLDLNHKKYRRVIFCADFDFFNKGRRTSRHNNFMPFAQYMLSVLHGNNDAGLKDNHFKTRVRILMTNLRQLVSVQYFQGATRVFYQILSGRGQRVGIINEENADSHAYYKSDGSWVYNEEIRRHTEKDVLAAVDKYVSANNPDGNVLNDFCGKNEHISSEAKETFSLLMNYLQSRGVEVLIFLCPFPPALYDKYDLNLRPLLPETEEFVRQYAKEHNIRVTGSYNPYQLGITNTDFYDARHVRREKLGVFFDFDRQ